MADKHEATFHGPDSNVPWSAIKPRDEISQEQIDFRDAASGVDLTELPVEHVISLSAGRRVFHEGFWCKVVEHEIQEHGIRLKLAREQAEGEALTQTPTRELIMQPGDYMYVSPERLQRSEERRRRIQETSRTQDVPRAFRRPGQREFRTGS